MDRAELEGLDRESLVVRAQAAGIRRARILTRPELIDELLRLDAGADAAKLERARGFFGRARDLLARVVERGLHLPDAADRIRSIGDLPGPPPPRVEPQAVPTVTLAEIYAAQGHKQRAIETLQRVLAREPDHVAARSLLDRLSDVAYVAPEPALPPEPEVEPVAAPEEPEPDQGEGPAAAVVSPPTSEEVDQEAVTIDMGARDAVPDSCVAVPLSGGARLVSWSLSARALAALAGRLPGGKLVVRVVAVIPSWDGPRSSIRDIPVETTSGELVLADLEERAVVRVALGWLDRDFVPVAHSPALETDRRGLVIWTLAGARPLSLDEAGSAPLARAVEAARRVASG